MKPRPVDLRRLDMLSFAADAQALDGEIAIAELSRLAASECPPDTEPAAEVAQGVPGDAERRHVRWRAVGYHQAVGGLMPQAWLKLAAQSTVMLQCQRCLQPVALSIELERDFRFVEDEATAAALDEEVEEDVLALPRSLDLLALIEDEMLLALPLVPHHDECPQPLPRSFEEPLEAPSQATHPFAKLASLRKRQDDGSDVA